MFISSVCQGDPAREDLTRPGCGYSPDNVWPARGSGCADRESVSRQGPNSPMVRHVHAGHGILRFRKQRGPQKTSPCSGEYSALYALVGLIYASATIPSVSLVFVSAGLVVLCFFMALECHLLLFLSMCLSVAQKKL